MTQAINFYLDGEYIELYKLLKLEGVAETGGMAKIIIEQGQVKVNHEIETRKRRKLTSGDRVVFDNVLIRIQSVD